MNIRKKVLISSLATELCLDGLVSILSVINNCQLKVEVLGVGY